MVPEVKSGKLQNIMYYLEVFHVRDCEISDQKLNDEKRREIFEFQIGKFSAEIAVTLLNMSYVICGYVNMWTHQLHAVKLNIGFTFLCSI